MNARIIHLINVIATGIVVTVMFSLALFWVRLFFNYNLVDELPEDALQVTIRPSGLVTGEPAPQQSARQKRTSSIPPGLNEPNFRFSEVYARTGSETILINAVGLLLQDIIAGTVPYRDVNDRVYYWYINENKYLCFDKHNGLITRHFKPDSEDMTGKGENFAGPNGMSGIAESSLGRFYEPIITRVWEKGPSRMCLYDKNVRRFYLIDFDEGIVREGLQLKEGDSREPVEIGEIGKGLNFNASLVSWNLPRIWNDANSKWERQDVYVADDAESSEKYRFHSFDWSLSFIPVLNKSGQIYIYNTSEQSLTLAGYLPFPESWYTYGSHGNVARPRDVLRYDVCPVYAIRRLPDDSKKPPEYFDIKYLGMNVACVSREGTSMTAAVFDANGNLVFRGDTKIDGWPTSSVVYSKAQLASTILFLLESLQPPVFEMASFLSGDIIEAGAGHRALFILPNSFLGMLGRYTGEHFDREVFGPILMGPSLILSVWLAWKVWKDAKLTGLSSTSRKWWMAGTVAFGLPAYITYRLTRPKETLVTCQNCGKMRRPDMERCHRCGSKWEMPELTPPSWRICD